MRIHTGGEFIYMALHLWLTDALKIFMKNESDYFDYVLSKTSCNSASLALSSYNK